MSKDFLTQNGLNLLREMEEEIEQDLKKIKEDGFQLSERKSVHRSILQEFGVLPPALRDLWLLSVYYEELGRRTKLSVLTRDEMKKQNVESVLLLHLTYFFEVKHSLKLSDLRVDRDWKLSELEEDPLRPRR
jgi:hypothetical protein